MPLLFAFTWVGFLTWLLLRTDAPATEAHVTPDRAAILALTLVLGWVVIRLRRAERRLKEVRAAVKSPAAPRSEGA